MSENRASSDDPGAPASVKLACRNVWKVYGPDPASFFPGEPPTGDAVAARATGRPGWRNTGALDSAAARSYSGKVRYSS